jgi:phospholipid/cholesterol/gamma-HCH transport system substrate-binding protein
MRKALIAGTVVAVIVAAIVLLSSRSNDAEGYVVRAVFDNGAFMVKGEEVRVAGANVGTIESVGVTMPGEYATYENGKPKPEPGKAVLVMKIEKPGFQDFRADASCLIRPQSLIGEKFVDCRPTLPRSAGSREAPPLEKIPDGQPGAGEYLLPVENNSTSVDPDLINNIQSLPYAQRFRLILNELGAGLAGRGEDLEEVIKRANPILRETDRLFGILANDRDRLAQLASDSEQILVPLARERAHVAGFFSNAGAAGEASAEKGEELEESLRKLPAFLREFRLTMGSLQGFSDAATPVFADFGKAAPAFTEATQDLAPFSKASTVALKSLGDTGEVVGPLLREADPVVIKSRDLARSGASPTTKLAKFLVSTEENEGWDGLVDLIYNSAGTVNEFDQYGHFGRSLAALTNCIDYVVEPQSECNANFNGPHAGASSSAAAAMRLYEQLEEELGGKTGGTSALPGAGDGGGSLAPATPSPQAAPAPAAPQIGEGEELGVRGVASPAQRTLLDYLLGP